MHAGRGAAQHAARNVQSAKDDDEAPKMNVGFMGDVQALKGQGWEDHEKEHAYDVTNFYYKTGCAANIARSHRFTHITLGMISINAIWMGIDTDLNNAETLADAEAHFQMAEHFFAFFFSAELLIRFLAFEEKRNCLRDGWFKFDSALCALMVFETYVLPSMASVGKMPFSTSMLRLLRLLRLSRMMRLLRNFPELLTLLKGMLAAVRSVFSTLVLLIGFMYVFAIIFRGQARGNEALEPYFGSMGLCFWTLLLHGTLLDDITDALTEIRDDSPHLAALFLVFVLLGNFTVLNMLVGVLCEVVSVVSDGEKEKMHLDFAKQSFWKVFHEMDVDGSGTISREEFHNFLDHPDCKVAFAELDVDRSELLTIADFIFEEEEEEEEEEKDPGASSRSKRLSKIGLGEKKTDGQIGFTKVIKAILNLRSTNKVKIKDVVELRKMIRANQKQTSEYFSQLSNQVRSLQQNGTSQANVSPRASRTDYSAANGGASTRSSWFLNKPLENRTSQLSATANPGNEGMKSSSLMDELAETVEDIDVQLKDQFQDAKRALLHSVTAAALSKTEGYVQDIDAYVKGRLATCQQVLDLLESVLTSGNPDLKISAEEYRAEGEMEEYHSPKLGLMVGGSLAPTKKPRAPGNKENSKGDFCIRRQSTQMVLGKET